ncbi:MAG: CitMHS family transporter [Rhodospirillaceae bacterium]
MLSFIGFATITVMMVLILKGKTLPAVCFAVLPVIGALLAGFSLPEILKFINTGVGTTWKTAVLFIFSVIYFGIMNDAGLFDKMVAALLRFAGNKIIYIMIATVLIAMVGHLDGATASTYLVTIPVMLPIFKKMQLRPTVMLLLVSVATGVMNIVPWGGPLIRAATAINADPQLMWQRLIPLQVVGLVTGLAMAVLFAVIERRRLAAAGIDLSAVADGLSGNALADGGDPGLKRPKHYWFNIVLTLLLIGGLIQGTIPAFILFMFGMVIALAVNYPEIKVQNQRMETHAPNCIGLTVTLLCAGVFLGVFSKSGMINAMAQFCIAFVPGFLARYIHVIVGVLGSPLGMIMGPDPYYYGILPLIGQVVAPFGISMESVANAMIIGENVALSVSPCVPTTFLAIGLAGVELKEHIRFSFLWLWGVSCIMLVFGIVTGVIGV